MWNMQNQLLFHQSLLLWHSAADWHTHTFLSHFPERSPFPEKESNFPSVLIAVFDSRQMRKQNAQDGLWNTKPFRGILSLLEGCLPFWKGFSSKQTSVTLPILHPIKIYWTHVENTVPPISGTTSLSQTNKYSDHKDKKINKKNPFPAFWVHNQHLIRCNDLQYDKSGKIYCDRLNGAQHKYNYSSHDLLHLPPPKEVHTKTTKDMQPAVICFFNLLLDISWCQKNKIKSSKATKCWGFNGELRWSLLQQSHVVVFDLKQNLRVNVKAVTLNFLFRDQCV